MHVTTTVAAFLEIPPYVLWPYVAGSALALLGLLAAMEKISQSDGWDRILALASVCLAPPLAVFGTEHLLLAKFVMNDVPAWMPFRLFWAYFVGVALIAAALSIAVKVQVHLSATLLGIMIFIFVLTVHTPKIIANPHDRIIWAVALRDSSFAGGAWALAGSQTEEWRNHGTNILVTIGRFLIAIGAIFFAVEHFRHPEFMPGVPLAKLTPTWIPIRQFVGYLTGAVLLLAGTSLLLGMKKRSAATCLGSFILFLVLLVYLPTVIGIPSAAQGGEKIEGLNYFFDTLLYSGAVLALAGAMPKPLRS